MFPLSSSHEGLSIRSATDSQKVTEMASAGRSEYRKVPAFDAFWEELRYSSCVWDCYLCHNWQLEWVPMRTEPASVLELINGHLREECPRTHFTEWLS